jgi:hypothetical protein
MIKLGLKSHMNAVGDLFESVDDLEKAISKLHYSKAKVRLECTLETLRRTAEHYADNTVDLYDEILDFTVLVAGVNQ